MTPGRIAGGDAYDIKGEHEKAIADFTEAIRLDPKDACGVLQPGRCLRREGRARQGNCRLRRRHSAEARSCRAFCNRGIAYGHKGEYDKAIADFTEAIRLEPETISRRIEYRGDAYAEKGEHDKAIADFTEVIRLDPKFAEAYCNRGRPTG